MEPSRNRLLKGPLVEEEIQPKPFARTGYRIKDGEAQLFTDRDEYQKARDSGEWTDTPAKTIPHMQKMGKNVEAEPEQECKYWIDGRCTREEEKEPEEEIATLDELTAKLPEQPKLITPDEHVNKKWQVGNMNLGELRMLAMKEIPGFVEKNDEEGKKLIRRDYINAIRRARNKRKNE